jgi:hypothetical protein
MAMDETERLVTVIRLACLTEDRSRAEQTALVETARRTDRAWNSQLMTNRRVAATAKRLGYPLVLTITHDGKRSGVRCTYQDWLAGGREVPPSEHPKACACRGDGYALEPEGGWSRLVMEVLESWQPVEATTARSGSTGGPKQ